MSEPNRTILVVDDDAELRTALRDTLELEGYAVVDAASGVDALAYLRSNPRPLLALVDWNMAPLSGRDFMHQVAGEPSLAELPVVLITADGRARQKAATAAFADYLVKPLSLDRLFSIIRHYER